MSAGNVRSLLLNPPLTDPTTAYHSIPYLVGAAVAAGFTNNRCVDLNIEALNHLARAEQVIELFDECGAIRVRLEADTRRSRADERLYRSASLAVGLEVDDVLDAIAVLRDPVRFYDPTAYRGATIVLRRWLSCLSVRGYPGQFSDDYGIDFTAVGNPSSVDDLTNDELIARLVAPFGAYLQGPFLELLRAEAWDVIGISVNYTRQLPFALGIARLVRDVVPRCRLVGGGTEIADVAKFARRPADVWRVFHEFDALVLGEGESAFVEILEAAARGEDIPRDCPGVFRAGESPLARAVRYEDLAALPSPRYDVWDWPAYWSPEPVVLYSPTRGCYWNRCTFCDYGLNTDGPTSPSRERPEELIAQDLREAMAVGRTLYLAVDAMSPRFLHRWATVVTARGLDIAWSAELRLERTFLRGLADDLRRSGCVALSFGYESASQRILDLIDKGVEIERVPAVLTELNRAGIAVQMMGFTGFPSETFEEACETYEFLLRNRDHWAIAGIGRFVLTPGAGVAKRPADFGVIPLAPGREDIQRSVQWTHPDKRRRTREETQVLSGLNRRISRGETGRPFVGIDTAHTILKFARFGPALPESRNEQVEMLSTPSP